MYYNYHGILQKKIRSGELKSYRIVDNYHGISPALLLIFQDGTIRPVREYCFHFYLELIEKTCPQSSHR